MTEIIRNELNQAQDVLRLFTNNDDNIASIERAADIMIGCIKSGGKIIACGNGGSMSDAMHFASELTGRYRKNRPAIPAIAISDPGHLSCVANDFGYEWVFSRFIEAHGKPGDVLLALSTSGKSRNVLAAGFTAIDKNMALVVIGGENPDNDNSGFGSPGETTYGVHIQIPHSGTADRTQEVTIIVLHILVNLIEKGVGV